MISCLYTLRLALVWQQRTRLWSLELLLQHDTCDAVCPRVWCWWSRPEQLYICSSRTLSALKPRINPADSSISKLGTKNSISPSFSQNCKWRLEIWERLRLGKFISCPEVWMRTVARGTQRQIVWGLSFESGNTHSRALSVSSISRPQLCLKDESWKNTRDSCGYLLFPQKHSLHGGSTSAQLEVCVCMFVCFFCVCVCVYSVRRIHRYQVAAISFSFRIICVYNMRERVGYRDRL